MVWRPAYGNPTYHKPAGTPGLEAQNSDYLVRMRVGERPEPEDRPEQRIAADTCLEQSPRRTVTQWIRESSRHMALVGHRGEAPLAQRNQRCLDLESSPDGVALLSAVFMYQHHIGQVLPEILDSVNRGRLDSFAPVTELSETEELSLVTQLHIHRRHSPSPPPSADREPGLAIRPVRAQQEQDAPEVLAASRYAR